MTNIKVVNGDNCHDILTENAERKLAFDKNQDYKVWREIVKQKLFELLKIQKCEENICPLNIEIEEDLMLEGYRRIRFTFQSEIGNTVPCYLLIPDTNKESYPVAIALQGHSSGFHNSIGEVKYDCDEGPEGRGAFGLQAVKNGFAALCIEQRGMGENRSARYPGVRGVHACAVTSLTALSLGRTIIGERVWDISRSIDALKEFENLGLDLEKIMVIGTSGGGTASFYSACYDERIKYCACSCAFCSFKASIMSIHHCVCNYVPDICDWFEMEDISCLIAPRKITVYAGVLDEIFPFPDVKKSYKTVEEIFKTAGCEKNCRLVPMPKGHYFCKDVVWPAVLEDIKELGW